jgi:hypothetical protein
MGRGEKETRFHQIVALLKSSKGRQTRPFFIKGRSRKRGSILNCLATRERSSNECQKSALFHEKRREQGGSLPGDRRGGGRVKRDKDKEIDLLFIAFENEIKAIFVGRLQSLFSRPGEAKYFATQAKNEVQKP